MKEINVCQGDSPDVRRGFYRGNVEAVREPPLQLREPPAHWEIWFQATVEDHYLQ